MNTITIKMTIENVPVEVKINENTNYHVLKETLRDTLCPVINTQQNWGRIIEAIRDTVSPFFAKP